MAIPKNSSRSKTNSGIRQPQRRRSSKRTRQVSSLQQMFIVDEGDENTADTAPDEISEASSKGSNTSQPPPILDFIGATCSASAWFTSCFPCAVVDINDTDDYVVDKLSRESAMNVMYNTNNQQQQQQHQQVQVSPGNNSILQGNTPDNSPQKVVEPGLYENGDVMYVSLDSSNDGPLYTLPSIIAEEDMIVEEIVALDDSENDDEGLGIAMPELTESTAVTSTNMPSPKKNKFGMKKLFGGSSKKKQ